jgi:hypothetical protein
MKNTHGGQFAFLRAANRGAEKFFSPSGGKALPRQPPLRSVHLIPLDSTGVR